LAWLRSSTLLTVPNVKNFKFRKSKMAAISRPRSKLHKAGDLQVGNWHVNCQHSSYLLIFTTGSTCEVLWCVRLCVCVSVCCLSIVCLWASCEDISGTTRAIFCACCLYKIQVCPNFYCHLALWVIMQFFVATAL